MNTEYLSNEKENEYIINISSELVKNVVEFSKECTSEISDDLFSSYVNIYLNFKSCMDRMNGILSFFDINSYSNIVEIGSGIGSSCICTKALSDANVFGVEPCQNSYSKLKECIEILSQDNPSFPYNSVQCAGEDIPLVSDSIDFVYSLEVLEHVRDPYKVLQEIHRILKKGGKAYIATCNYDSFYEGHYKKFWNPFISPQKNKDRYVSQGDSPIFFNDLNFITKKRIMDYVSRIGYTSIQFDPKPIIDKNNAVLTKINCSEDVKKILTTYKNKRPTTLARLIQAPKISNFLKRFNREYKLYFLLTK
ncbi:Ubiquinone/menaquinone biosynthesis C-methylase UbiE [Succinivibrio dextrinosolvens]|uniref:class I SAM-dependent methyltransferase n=1 Tax=Succinivibrio dextrinosolvens TaxID=83771 RepID=UPI0008E2AFD5|nr:class I SAM-dependent methyltransferase [Succinivibrio dextrinosolvens]SFS90667.1 Ubiquinone/menaquinone biosynthesis C-methylase UbiE [Succinivibrio dextrinosolvens]